MKITKLGHCCLLIETKGKRILTDPGLYSIDEHSNLTDIDFVLFTHEHGDHFHLESLKGLLVTNPQMQIYVSIGVGELLERENIAHTVVRDGENLEIAGIALQGIGTEHAPVHPSIPLPINTGFFIDDRLWYPGDAFLDPKRPVEILALPVAGPWMRLSEAVDYAVSLKPKSCFPVHDGMLRPDRIGLAHILAEKVLSEIGTEFVPMIEGSVREF